jgi:hypothetical protein
MNKLILIPILFGVAAAIFISLFVISDDTSQESQSKKIYKTGFSYYDVEKIKTSLAKKNISMSTPTAIYDHTIDQYCTFFDAENVQKNVEYCTTTAIMDSDGTSFGNINMGGVVDGPTMALAIIDASPFLDSKKAEVDFVFQIMIETLVCNCWDEQQPGGFESVYAWLDAAEEKYSESSQNVPLKSKITGLDDKTLILEIASVGESYRWALIVLK